MKEGRRNAGLSYFAQWLSYSRLCATSCSFTARDIEARSAALVLIGLTQLQAVSIGTAMG